MQTDKQTKNDYAMVLIGCSFFSKVGAHRVLFLTVLSKSNIKDNRKNRKEQKRKENKKRKEKNTNKMKK